jgi:hypothetical protein
MIRRTALTARALAQFFAAFLLWSSLAGTAGAATVRPMGLDEVIDSATTAFQGTCIGNRSERDAQTNLIVTYTTFAVDDVLKGTVPATHTIKQIGGTLASEGMGFRVEGIPTFAVGQSYVVFLAGVSSAGFSSPIGLGHGQFTVTQETTGPSVMVRGAIPDAGPGTSVLLAPGVNLPTGRVSLDEFKQAVRARLGRTQ